LTNFDKASAALLQILYLTALRTAKSWKGCDFFV